jgi:hypothetical protein
MIGGQEEREGKTYDRKNDQNPGVKVGPLDIVNDPQGKEQDVDGTGTVQHGKDKEKLGHVGLLLPKRYKTTHDSLLNQTYAAATGPPLFTKLLREVAVAIDG